jgi:hypothetical protein
MNKNNREVFYTYELIDPRDNKVFYVGKGCNKRMYSHEKTVARGQIIIHNSYLTRKINKILSLGLKIIYKKQLENVTEQEALDLEEYLIGYYGLKNLCNSTSGGVASSPTEDVKRRIGQKNSIALKGRKQTESERLNKSIAGRKSEKKKQVMRSAIYRKHSSDAKKGEKNGMYGKNVYDIWVEKYGKEEADRRLKNKKEKLSKNRRGINNPASKIGRYIRKIFLPNIMKCNVEYKKECINLKTDFWNIVK